MTDRPIIFSTAMVQALLAGRKTQTRRLASSPLRRVEVGDLLWVREGFRNAYDATFYLADGPPTFEGGQPYPDGLIGKGRPSIHMPRWASRLTLEVTEVRRMRLQDTSDEDALAEGVHKEYGIVGVNCAGGVHQEEHGYRYFATDQLDDEGREHASDAFMDLWDSLHTKPGERWEDNPEIVALTFRVHPCNVDAFSRLAQADSPKPGSGASHG